MTDAKTTRREGLSLQTLVIAAAASAVAAILVSHFWKGGTVIAAAMTPVIVAIVKDLLARPIESEIVRKPVKRVSSAIAPGATRDRAGERRFERPLHEPVGARGARSGLPAQPPADLPVGRDGLTPEGLTPGDVVLTHPRRTYGGNGRRLRLKLAIVTGLLAFAIAVVALTVPELIFGGAVASHGSTTFIGGGSSKSQNSGTGSSRGNNQKSSTTPQSQQQTNTSTQSTTPQSTTTQPQQAPPAQQQQTTPAPTPAAPSPPSGGGSTTAPSSP